MNRFLVAFVTFIVTLAVAVPLILLSFNWYEQLLIESLWWHVTVILIAGTSALLFWAFRDKIFHKLRLTTRTALEDVADPLLEMVNKLVSGNGVEASAQARVFVRRFISRYAAIKSMTWIVGTVFAFLAIFATMAASAILIKQNSIIMTQNTLIESQNKYFQEQNQKIQLQIDNQKKEERNANRSKLIEILYEGEFVSRDKYRPSSDILEKESRINPVENRINIRHWALNPNESPGGIGGVAAKAIFNALRRDNRSTIRQPKFNLRSRREAFEEFIKYEFGSGKEIIDLRQSILDGLDSTTWNVKDLKIDLSGAQLIGCDFSDCNLTNLIFDVSRMESCDCINSIFSRTFLRGVDLENSNLTYSDFSQADITHGNLRQTKIEGANFFNANLRAVDLTEAVNLAFIDQQPVNYIKRAYITDFSESNMAYAVIDNAFMVNVIFYRTNLLQANLSNTNFKYSVFIEANLRQANLSGSRLIKTNCRNAIFTNANLNNTVLENASVAGADLRGATFNDAEFTNIDFEDAIVDSPNWFQFTSEVAPTLSKYRKYWTVRNVGTINGEKIYRIKKNSSTAVKPQDIFVPLKVELEQLQKIFLDMKKIRGIDRDVLQTFNVQVVPDPHVENEDNFPTYQREPAPPFPKKIFP